MTVSSLITGRWGDATWQFIIDDKHPPVELSTAAFCVVTFKNKLVLVEHAQRGFEFAGGHVDQHESIEVTVCREVLEESGAVISNPVLFGYKKVSPLAPVPHRDNPKVFYPFPYSYVPYFYAEAEEIRHDANLTNDVKNAKLFSLEEARRSLALGHFHEKILEHLIVENLIQVSAE